MSRTMQLDLFGGRQVAGNVVDKLTYILEEYPEARESYKAAMFLYWAEFEGLREVLGDKVASFREWLVGRATSPKTLQNRVQEIQNDRPDLETSADTEKWRQQQSRRGRVV